MKRTSEKTLARLEKQADKIGGQINAIRAAIRRTTKERDDAVYMVEKVPGNIYHEDWVREVAKLNKELDALMDIEKDLSRELDAVWSKIYKAEK